jgi:hypothetical protein
MTVTRPRIMLTEGDNVHRVTTMRCEDLPKEKTNKVAYKVSIRY